VAPVLQPHYRDAASFFGLRAYIKSLKRLKDAVSGRGGLILFPSHRIYYNGRWNRGDAAERIVEVIRHHVERCGAILEILRKGPKTDEQIAKEHFPEELLEGFGRIMAANEVVSHCELLIRCGDVVPAEGEKYIATGTRGFEAYIEGLDPYLEEETERGGL